MDSAQTMAIHRFLLRTSLAVGNLFVWILVFHALYVTGETVQGALLLTVLAYLFAQLLIFFITPLAGMNVRYGTARSMIMSSLALSAGFIWIASASRGVFSDSDINIWWGIVGFVVLSALYRAFYWVPYSAVGVSSRNAWTPRTRFLLEIFLALAPAVSATLIATTHDGAWVVFVGAAVFSFFAAISLIPIRDSYERFEYGYADTIEQLFSAKNRHVLGTSIMEGIQGAGLLFIWPVTLFLIFSWSYSAVGLLLSITLLIALLTRHGMPRYVRSVALQNTRVLAMVMMGAWVTRLIAIHPVSIIIADSMSHTFLPLRRVGIDPVSFEQAADAHHYIDEYTAFKEMGMALGRICAGIILVGSLFYAEPIVALALTLITAAVASIIHLYRPGS